MKYSKRLTPGQDLKKEIKSLVKDEGIIAGCILCGVGSLASLRLRMADGKTVKEWTGPFEIVSMIGTVSTSKCHVHISVSDQEGQVLGGHIKEGCIVHTTVELVIESFEGTEFVRELDPETGYDELFVKRG